VLFDLKSGKRRRVVQIVFGGLAFLFFISFVGFGIGSDVSGGIFDAIGVGGGSGSSDPQYEEQIEDAENRLETNPNDQRALVDLASYHYLSGTEGVSTDPETGITEVSEDARQELEEAVAAWENYLETDPKRPDTGVAANIAQAYVVLEDAGGAAEAQRIVAESQDSSAAYGQLAFYLYADLKIPAGDAAADQAVEAAEESNRDSVRKSLERIAEQAAKRKKQLEKEPQGASGGGQGIEDPFGALGGGAGAPTAPPTTP
jgi:hypothetical protein